MFEAPSFESLKALFPKVDGLNPAAAQEAVQPLLDNLKAWGELTQAHAQATQAVALESFEALKAAKEPQAAIEIVKANAEKSIALGVKHAQEAAALSVAQFNAGVDAISAKHPAPEAFAGVAKGLKAAASTAEATLTKTLKSGAAATKKARG
jgi:hypothetical protein